MADESYLIVGAGVFGASTAFHLIRKYPNATIKLVDREPFPCQLGASWDWNKVIRAEYADLFYMKLALEAKAIWESDPLFKPFYHEAGAVWIADFDLADTISENYAKLGLGDNAMRYTIEEARKIYGGMFDRTEFTGVDRVLVSPRTGWAEASKALVKVIQAAVGKGVTYINASVTSLLFNGTGECVGVHTAGEDNLMASKIVLCTGAYTAKLLADSAPDREDLHAGDRFIAAGMCTALMTPEPDACKHFKDVPIVLHGRINHEGRGGFIPPTPEGNFKWWVDITFTRLAEHPCGTYISTPPQGPFQAQWDVPEPFRKEMERGREVIFGDKEDRFGFDSYRFCWDAISRDDNFFVTEHPVANNLYIATIGSFHSYKFLPIIGKYVTEMLEGKLGAEHQKRWAWNRGMDEGGEGHVYWPKRDWVDVMNKLK